jgi:hypothetical protein
MLMFMKGNSHFISLFLLFVKNPIRNQFLGIDSWALQTALEPYRNVYKYGLSSGILEQAMGGGD